MRGWRRGLLSALALAVLLIGVWFAFDPRLGVAAARLDLDADGRLSPAELGPIGRHHLEALDRDGSGDVDGAEFRRFMARRLVAGTVAALQGGDATAASTLAPAVALDARLAALVDDGRAAGVAMQLVRAGEVVYSGAAGTLDAQRPVALGDASALHSAVVFACLDARGELPWDQPLATGPLQLPGPWGQRSLLQLLAHAAGAPTAPLSSLTADVGLAARGRTLLATRLPGAPALAYGPAGLQLAGALAELGTGKRWRRLYVECVSWPLSLASARWGHPVMGPSRVDEPVLLSGLHLSLADHVRLLRMLQTGGVFGGVRNLPAATVRTLGLPQTRGLERRELPTGVEPDWEALPGAWCEQAEGAGPCLRWSSFGRLGMLTWLHRDSGLGGAIFTTEAYPRVEDWLRQTRALAERRFTAPAAASLASPESVP